MKILCFIDSLGSGGAQRQIVNLAKSFSANGHDVELLTYSNANFYAKEVENANIKRITIPPCSYIKRIWQCIKHIRKGKYDAVLSFLETPSLIAEFATIPYHNWVNISGERSAAPRILKTAKGKLLRYIHILSDYVVANSYSNISMIKKACPILPKSKLKVIYNQYDINGILSPERYIKEKRTDKKFHLLIASSHRKLKNIDNLAVAIQLLPHEKRERIVVDWYGNKKEAYYKDSLKLIKELGIENNFVFYDPSLDIYSKMVNADAVGLFSLYEGLPNTICEAMCLSKPVIATDVSDNKILIDNKKLISAPTNPKDISNSISYLLDLSKEELEKIGKNNREKALKLFSPEHITNQYIELFTKL